MPRKPTTPPTKPLREWRVSLIGAKSKYVGRIAAADAESAVAKAAEEFGVEPARRFRLIAQGRVRPAQDERRPIRLLCGVRGGTRELHMRHVPAVARPVPDHKSWATIFEKDEFAR